MADRKDDWWKAGDDDIGRRVCETFKHLDEYQSHHRHNIQKLKQVYCNRRGIRDDEPGATLADRLKLNICKSIVDAGMAQISTNRPRPMYLTEKGNFELRERAKSLNKYMLGQFYAIQQYRKARRVFQYAGITGTGLEKTYEIGGKIYAEHVPTEEVLVDDREAIYGEPRAMFHHKQVERSTALKAWPKFAADIETAAYIRDDLTTHESIGDPVSVIEAWHLPSGPDEDDGRHVIALSTCAPHVEKWKRERFPVSAFRLSEAPDGFWGIGWVEELLPIQLEINYTLMKIQEAANLFTNQLWMRKRQGSGRITNKQGGVNFYNDTPPTVLKFGGVPQDLLAHVQFLEQKAYEISGISQLSAQSQKPAGLNSGEALKTYNDIGTRRFQHIGQAWEEFHVNDISESILDLARDIEERGDGDIAVMTQGDRDIETISFKDVKIDRDKYVTKVWPVSLFPDTPSGKLDRLEKFAQFSPQIQEQLIPLMDMPDLEAISNRINAPFAIVEKQLSLMLEHGKPQTPFPYMDLRIAREQGTLALLGAEADDTPEENKELVRNWLVTLNGMQAAAAPQEQPAPEGQPQPMTQALTPGQAEAPGPMSGEPTIQ